MAWELEGLIARLLMFISCAGEQGCSVIEFIEIVKSTSCSSEGVAAQQPGWMPRDSGTVLTNRAVGTIWRWLVERNDISVGHGRKYNHLTLDEVLALLGFGRDGQDGLIPSTPSHNSTRTGDARIYASEETMWEAITGHAVDYKRVPRSEWLLLLGIASTTAQGILQGDLGRLVDQDKRSVPKRTDALVKKGYITKRTTLVRGTKTSKMWLKPFAPPLPRDGGAATEPEAEMNLSHQVLAINLEPVPWHTRWTGESVDYTALATTIMATCKEWGVMRMQDLKAKLGVLGMRWQMKVVSKICRFLNARDAIRYVAAKLDHKVFKDCIRFNRDLTAKDWSIFLATGKRAGKPVRAPELYSHDGNDKADQLFGRHASTLRLSIAPPWSVDQPLPITIAKAIIAFGESGLTNPDVYGLTLGASFTRFLSSMTTSMSTPNIQPVHLKHLQVKSEHSRVGKVASYRYSISQEAPYVTGSLSFPEEQDVACSEEQGSSSAYGFPPTVHILHTVTFADLCSVGLSQRKQRGRPRKIKSEPKKDTKRGSEGVPQEAPRPATPFDEVVPQAMTTLIVNLKVQQNALQSLLDGSRQPYTTLEDASGEQTPLSRPALGDTADDKDMLFESPEQDLEVKAAAPPSRSRGRGRSRGRSRGRGGGRRQDTTQNDEASNSKPWKCTKCGGTWKNDIGLKYHLEKSQTSCNSSYSPSTMEASRRSRRSAILSRKGYISPERAASASTRDPGSPNSSQGTSVADDSALSLQGDLQPKNKLIHKGVATQHVASRPTGVLFEGSSLLERGLGRPIGQSTSRLNRPVELSSSSLGQVALIYIGNGSPRQMPPLGNRLHRVNGLDKFQGSQTVQILSTTTASVENATSKVSTQPSQGQRLPPAEAVSQHGTTFKSGGGVSHKSPRCDDHQRQSRNGSRKKGTRHEAADRISAVILDMLTEQNGVIPGGESLWRALMAVWGARFPDEPAPKAKDCQWALSRMLKAKSASEHWHGFQGQNGLFSKCQIISLPHLDAFSTESLLVVDKIKQFHPQLYIPTPFLSVDNDTQPQDKKDIRRGRRVLAGEVAVLDAPVYAAQVAAKRGPDTADEPTNSVKRRRFAQHARHGVGFIPFPQSIQDEYQIRWATETWPSGRHGTAPTCENEFAAQMGANIEVQFLAPNTYLEDDPPNYEVTEPRLTTDSRPETMHAGDAVQNDLLLDDSSWDVKIVEPPLSITGWNGAWPYLDSHYFEGASDSSFTMRGWMPDMNWLAWEIVAQDIEKRPQANGTRRRSIIDENVLQYRFMERLMACLDLELMHAKSFINAPPLTAGPYNVFVRFSSELDNAPMSSNLVWLPQEQLTLESVGTVIQELEASSPSSDDEDSQLDFEIMHRKRPKSSVEVSETTQPSKIKRVALVTRALTAISTRVVPKDEKHSDSIVGEERIGNRAEIMAAFIAVRVLLGGADKAIDWGLLVKIFPGMGLASLRRFWTTACKEQGPYIKKFTRDFQDRLIEAYEKDELPIVDFENPLSYDWRGLIKWTTHIPRQEGLQIPQTRALLDSRFALEDTKSMDEDWREKFFHVQSSIFSRFEAVTSRPGAITIDDGSSRINPHVNMTDIDIAKSWVKSLCCTRETKYSVQQIRDKFLLLSKDGQEESATLLKAAVDQLTRQRVICRSKKPPLGGRPYRLSEWYVSTLSKIAQRSKYDEAAAFKDKMDDIFRRQETLEVPYTLNDGSMMALTNLNATGRIRLVPMGVPNIPFGFEPGNYESRKYPKSYYHFRLEAMPTDKYQYNEDIDVLRAVAQEDLPSSGLRGEIPQWIDFFGDSDSERWSEILGAFCFAFATRGSMTIEGVCSALGPILEEFEAQLIVEWGKKTGVIEGLMGDMGSTVGEWWWLAVPWQYRSRGII